MSETHRLPGGDYIGLSQDSSAHYFELASRNSNTEETSEKGEDFSNWDSNLIDLDDYQVFPNGGSNDIPKQIQEATLPNSIAPRIQNRKVELLFDQGVYLYELKEGVRIPKDNEFVSKWLNSFDYIDTLISNANNYYYSNAVFTKIFRSKEGRYNKTSTNVFSKLESVSSFDARLAKKKTSKGKNPTHVIIGDWYNSNNIDKSEFQVYPIFNPAEPTKFPVSIHVSTFKTFGMNQYALPEIYGALPWIKRNTAIPNILKSLTDNSLNIKWHITSPASHWEKIKKELMDRCKQNGQVYKDSMLEDVRRKQLDTLTKVLSGIENVGKFWHNTEVTKIIGASAIKEGWDIKPIEQKIKDYVQAQLDIALSSAKFVLSSLGLHSALANVGPDGKSDSGSEQIYALKIHQFTSTRLPEYYVCKAFNEVLKLKFGPNIHIGFKKASIDAESETTPNRRLKNQVE